MEAQLQQHYGSVATIGHCLNSICKNRHDAIAISVIGKQTVQQKAQTPKKRLRNAWDVLSKLYADKVTTLVSEIRTISTKTIIEHAKPPMRSHTAMIIRLVSMHDAVRTALKLDMKWVRTESAAIWTFLKTVLPSATELIQDIEDNTNVALDSNELTIAKIIATNMTEIMLAIEDVYNNAIQMYTDVFYALMEGAGQVNDGLKLEILKTLSFFISVTKDIATFINFSAEQQESRLKVFSAKFAKHVLRIASLISAENVSQIDMHLRSQWAHAASYGQNFTSDESISEWFVLHQTWLSVPLSFSLRHYAKTIFSSLHGITPLITTFIQPAMTAFKETMSKTDTLSKYDLNIVQSKQVLEKLVSSAGDKLLPETLERVTTAIAASTDVISSYTKHVQYLEKNTKSNDFTYNKKVASLFAQSVLAMTSDDSDIGVNMDNVEDVYQYYNGQTPAFEFSIMEETITRNSAVFLVALSEIYDLAPLDGPVLVGGRTKPNTAGDDKEKEEDKPQPKPFYEYQEELAALDEEIEAVTASLDEHNTKTETVKDVTYNQYIEGVEMVLAQQKKRALDEAVRFNVEPKTLQEEYANTLLQGGTLHESLSAIMTISRSSEVNDQKRNMYLIKLAGLLEQKQDIILKARPLFKTYRTSRLTASIFAAIMTCLFGSALWYLFIFSIPITDVFLNNAEDTSWIPSWISSNVLTSLSFVEASNTAKLLYHLMQRFSTVGLTSAAAIPRAIQFLTAGVGMLNIQIAIGCFIYYMIFSFAMIIIDYRHDVGHSYITSTKYRTTNVISERVFSHGLSSSIIHNLWNRGLVGFGGHTLKNITSIFMTLYIAILAGQWDLIVGAFSSTSVSSMSVTGLISGIAGPILTHVLQPGQQLNSETGYLGMIRSRLTKLVSPESLMPGVEVLKKFQSEDETAAYPPIVTLVKALKVNGELNQLLDSPISARLQLSRLQLENEMQQRQLLQLEKEKAATAATKAIMPAAPAARPLTLKSSPVVEEEEDEDTE